MATQSLITGTVAGTGAFSPACTFQIMSGSGYLIDTTVINTTFVPTATGSAIIRATSMQDPSKFDDVSITISVIPEIAVMFNYGIGQDPRGSLSYPDNILSSLYTEGHPECGPTPSYTIEATLSSADVVSLEASAYLVSNPNNGRITIGNFEPAITIIYFPGSGVGNATIRIYALANPANYLDVVINVTPVPKIISLNVDTVETRRLSDNAVIDIAYSGNHIVIANPDNIADTLLFPPPHAFFANTLYEGGIQIQNIYSPPASNTENVANGQWHLSGNIITVDLPDPGDGYYSVVTGSATHTPDAADSGTCYHGPRCFST